MARVRHRHPSVSVQAPLPFVARSVREDPINLGADCGGVCGCDDGLDYFIKDRTSDKHLPHTEWFCSQLADSLGIAGPPFRIIRKLDGSIVFGSRCEGGIIKAPSPSWPELILSGRISPSDISAPFTRIYVFDLFVHNIDRHQDNILARDQRSGVALLSVDYSRAWIVNGFPLPALPLSPQDATVYFQRDLSRFCGGSVISPIVAREFAETIKNVPVSRISEIIKGHPKDWLATRTKSAIIRWWKSDARIERIERIAGGIDDGTYL